MRMCVDKQTAQSEREFLGGVDVETEENLSTALSDRGESYSLTLNLPI